jgi:hypothetical protein
MDITGCCPLEPDLSPFSCSAVLEAAAYEKKNEETKMGEPKTRLGLPDLDQSKAAAIGSLRSGVTQAVNDRIGIEPT